jgi:hypothetical protein
MADGIETASINQDIQNSKREKDGPRTRVSNDASKNGSDSNLPDPNSNPFAGGGG